MTWVIEFESNESLNEEFVQTNKEQVSVRATHRERERERDECHTEREREREREMR